MDIASWSARRKLWCYLVNCMLVERHEAFLVILGKSLNIHYCEFVSWIFPSKKSFCLYRLYSRTDLVSLALSGLYKPLAFLILSCCLFRFSSSGFTIKVISRLLTPYSLANLRWLMPVVAYRKAISDFCSGVSFCRRSYCDPRMIIFSLLYGMSLHC